MKLIQRKVPHFSNIRFQTQGQIGDYPGTGIAYLRTNSNKSSSSQMVALVESYRETKTTSYDLAPPTGKWMGRIKRGDGGDRPVDPCRGREKVDGGRAPPVGVRRSLLRRRRRGARGSGGTAWPAAGGRSEGKEGTAGGARRRRWRRTSCHRLPQTWCRRPPAPPRRAAAAAGPRRRRRPTLFPRRRGTSGTRFSLPPPPRDPQKLGLATSGPGHPKPPSGLRALVAAAAPVLMGSSGPGPDGLRPEGDGLGCWVPDAFVARNREGGIYLGLGLLRLPSLTLDGFLRIPVGVSSLRVMCACFLGGGT